MPQLKSKLVERTFLVLLLALTVHTALTFGFFHVLPATWVATTNPYILLTVVLALLACSGLAGWFGSPQRSKTTQATGLALYVLVEAVLFVPLVHSAVPRVGVAGLYVASATTLAVFAGLVGYVLQAKADFRGLRPYLVFLTLGSAAVVVAGFFTGWTFGVVFSGAMAVLGSTWILYDASNLVHKYEEGEEVAAALYLLSSLAFTLWHVVRALR